MLIVLQPSPKQPDQIITELSWKLFDTAEIEHADLAVRTEQKIAGVSVRVQRLGSSRTRIGDHLDAAGTYDFDLRLNGRIPRRLLTGSELRLSEVGRGPLEDARLQMRNYRTFDSGATLQYATNGPIRVGRFELNPF